VLVYERPGDHVGWHYDHNFYRGRHFTLLLPVMNAGRSANGISHTRLSAKIEGAKVLHKVSPILDGERRVVINMNLLRRCALQRRASRRTPPKRYRILRHPRFMDLIHGRVPPRPEPMRRSGKQPAPSVIHSSATSAGHYFTAGFVPRPTSRTTDLAPEDEWDAVATDFGLLAERLGC
jgi:hypothetical protein